MFASLSTTVVTLAGGETVTIRKLSGTEWLTVARMMTDAGAAQERQDQAAHRAHGDEADAYALACGVVAWSVDRPVDATALNDLDADARKALIEAILRHTRPDYFTPADEAVKNASGPSTATSATKGQPPTSGD